MNTEEERSIFLIPDTNLGKFEAACAKLSRKAVKLGCSEIKPLIFGYQIQKLNDGHDHKLYEVYLTCDTPKVDGYTFVARLDHTNETGNIIRLVPNLSITLPEKYQSCAPHCDHCNLNRKRRDTFVLRCDETGDFKQVGSSCLIDFFGHDPLKIARLAELLGYAYEAGRGYETFTGGSLNDYRWVNVEEFCVLTAYAIRNYGWVSGKAAYENSSLLATRKIALDWYCRGSGYVVATDEDKALASEALAWAASLRDRDDVNEYESNIRVIAESQMIEVRSCGLAASIVGVFFKNRQREIERAAKALATKDSNYVGTVGEKLKDLVVTITGTNVVNNNFGTSFVYRMLSSEGDVLTWFASKTVPFVEGASYRLSGTVKGHQEYRGVKQTVVTRCKLC